ncbi:hypothetical protein, partial [Vibrio parahaemolyticus]|uniref:hypothetical protein n=1 Tax=Vibrio parahaemolyticus TaxID=670 RepID=UPI00287AF27C
LILNFLLLTTGSPHKLSLLKFNQFRAVRMNSVSYSSRKKRSHIEEAIASILNVSEPAIKRRRR